MKRHRGTRNRHGLLTAVGPLLCLAAACSKAPSAATEQTHVDPCGGLKSAAAAAILNIPVGDVQGPQTSTVFSCLYRSKSHPFMTLTFNVYAEASDAAAQRALDNDKQGLAVLSPITPLARLGDEAYRAPDPRVRRLLMRKGRVWIDIVTPGDQASQQRIARIVLEHLP
ncbi:MAG: hypothetical protein P8076_05285 [Gammaproteobacteria bacterium]